ncbi:chemotaxis protein CheW [Methylosinus sporium]|uniref:chemotaxis protein CheW n=1 Tax=Methylosinus sporium TaxID=428 RepID=UPI00383BF1CD
MSQEAQFVTLGLDGEVFGVPVALVREILDFRQITRLPQAPAFVLGMIDVRGTAVPIVDLLAKLGLPSVEPTHATRLIVADVPFASGEISLGLLVDCVFEVTELDRDALDEPPQVGGRWRAECIAGIGRRKGGFVVIFDLPHLLAQDDEALASAASAQRAA